jgi:hypothetical protein
MEKWTQFLPWKSKWENHIRMVSVFLISKISSTILSYSLVQRPIANETKGRNKEIQGGRGKDNSPDPLFPLPQNYLLFILLSFN